MRKYTLPALLPAILALGGCIVVQNSQNGTVEVRWDSAGGCGAAGIEEVQVRLSTSQQVQVVVSGIPCSRGAVAVAVEAGVYDVRLEGLSSGGAVVATASVEGLAVSAGETVSTPVIMLGGAAVTVGWTLGGKSPAVGCALAHVDTIVVSVLDDKQKNVLAFAEAPCLQGKLTVHGVLPGSARYVQIDGYYTGGKSDLLVYGNASLDGPYEVAVGTEVVVQPARNLVDLRPSIGVRWAFTNGGSCAANKASHVLVEVRDANDKVLIPMSDSTAAKPCELGPGLAVASRAIDLDFVDPACMPPDSIPGLVICGISGKALGLFLSSLEASTNTIAFGGSMKVMQIPDSGHTEIASPLLLAPCGPANLCHAP